MFKTEIKTICKAKTRHLCELLLYLMLIYLSRTSQKNFMPEKNPKGATSDFSGAGWWKSAHSAWILNSKTELKRQWSSILRPPSMIPSVKYQGSTIVIRTKFWNYDCERALTVLKLIAKKIK